MPSFLSGKAGCTVEVRPSSIAMSLETALGVGDKIFSIRTPYHTNKITSAVELSLKRLDLSLDLYGIHMYSPRLVVYSPYERIGEKYIEIHRYSQLIFY